MGDDVPVADIQTDRSMQRFAWTTNAICTLVEIQPNLIMQKVVFVTV